MALGTLDLCDLRKLNVCFKLLQRPCNFVTFGLSNSVTSVTQDLCDVRTLKICDLRGPVLVYPEALYLFILCDLSDPILE